MRIKLLLRFILPPCMTRYSNNEIAALHLEFMKGTPLSDLEQIVGKPVVGIVRKLSTLVQNDPGNWDPERVGWYLEQFQAMGREKYLAKRRKYNLTHAEENRAKAREYYGIHRERILNGKKRRNQENHDELLRRKRHYYLQHRRELLTKNRQYRQRKRMQGLIQDMIYVGYDIGEIRFSPGTVSQLDIELVEEDIDISLAQTDFREHVRRATLSAKVHLLYGKLEFSHGENSVRIIGYGDESLAFLGAYKKALERELKPKGLYSSIITQ